MLLCSETFCHILELLVIGFGRSDFFLSEQVASRTRVGSLYKDEHGAFQLPKFESGCCKMIEFSVCSAKQDFYVFSLFHNPDLDHWIFYCLFTTTAAVKAENVRDSYLCLI